MLSPFDAVNDGWADKLYYGMFAVYISVEGGGLGGGGGSEGDETLDEGGRLCVRRR